MKHRYVDGSSIGRKINDTQTIEKTPTNIDTHTHGEIRVGRRRCRELDAQIKDVSAQVRDAQVNRPLSVRNELLFYHIWAENIHGSSHERASANRPRGRPATCTTRHGADPPRGAARPRTPRALTRNASNRERQSLAQAGFLHRYHVWTSRSEKKIQSSGERLN